MGHWLQQTLLPVGPTSDKLLLVPNLHLEIEDLTTAINYFFGDSSNWDGSTKECGEGLLLCNVEKLLGEAVHFQILLILVSRVSARSFRVDKRPIPNIFVCFLSHADDTQNCNTQIQRSFAFSAVCCVAVKTTSFTLNLSIPIYFVAHSSIILVLKTRLHFKIDFINQLLYYTHRENWLIFLTGFFSPIIF